MRSNLRLFKRPLPAASVFFYFGTFSAIFQESQQKNSGRPMAARRCKIYDRMRRGRCPHRPKSLPSGGRWLRREAEQTDEGMEHSSKCNATRYCSPALIRPSVRTGAPSPKGKACGSSRASPLQLLRKDAKTPLTARCTVRGVNYAVPP